MGRKGAPAGVQFSFRSSSFRRRSFSRIFIVILLLIIFRLIFGGGDAGSAKSLWQDVIRPATSYDGSGGKGGIEQMGWLERMTRIGWNLNLNVRGGSSHSGRRSSSTLDARKNSWLQERRGREMDIRRWQDLEGGGELLGGTIRDGVRAWWDDWQLPYILSKETASQDAQHVLSSIEQLLSLNGWVAALCPTLTRPFRQNKQDQNVVYDELLNHDDLYFFAVVVHSADHFLVDQLAVIVQMAKRIEPSNIFVSILDYDSTDSTQTLIDLAEAVLILLGVPFRIRHVHGMTEDPAAAYYPLEEAYARNLALEPLLEMDERRGVRFKRVIWLKGFTCPNDILELVRVSIVNEAAMVCGMDWAEHNGFFIFSDRWRTRDIQGDQFRQSKSSSKLDAVPPRDRVGAERFGRHQPFQVFCCEAGTHVVDPAQSYYKKITYRAGEDYYNLSRPEMPKPLERNSDSPCLDSSQAWFCRDLWIRSAHDAMEEIDKANGWNPLVDGALGGYQVDGNPLRDDTQKQDRRADGTEPDNPKRRKIETDIVHPVKKRQAGGIAAAAEVDADANAGSDYDAVSDEEGGAENVEPLSDQRMAIPNSLFRPARILVNPRCVTTYAGVSHTQLALDLFGDGEGGEGSVKGGYVLDDWEGAPESFVCQEQRSTGGRKATKTQRRLGFSIYEELQKLQSEQ